MKSALVHFLLIASGVGVLYYYVKKQQAGLAGSQQNQPGTSQSGVPQYDPQTQEYSVAPLRLTPSMQDALPSTTVQGNQYGGVGGNSFSFGGSPQYFDFSKPFTYNQAPVVPVDAATAAKTSDCGCDPCASACVVTNSRFLDGRGTDLAPSRRQQLINSQNKNGGASATWGEWSKNVLDGLSADPMAVFESAGAFDIANQTGAVPASNIYHA